MMRAFVVRYRVSLLFLFWIAILASLVVSSETYQAHPADNRAGTPGGTTIRLERFLSLQPVATPVQKQEQHPATNEAQPGSGWHAANELDDLPRPLVSLEQLFVFPEKAVLLGIRKALVLAEIDLDATGRIRACRIVRGAGNGFDEEVLSKLPSVRFTPGRIDGQAVAVRARLPVRFLLGKRR